MGCLLAVLAARCATLVVLLDEQEEALDQVGFDASAHAAGTAYQTGLTLPPIVRLRTSLGVEAFHDAGLSRAFSRGTMLLLREETTIHFEVVRDDQFSSIVLRHVRPAQLQGGAVPVAQRKAQYLAQLPRHRDPQPQARGLAYTELVHLDNIVFGSRQRSQRLFFYTVCPFLRTERTVLRLTLSIRAMPCWEMRSESARSMAACLSGQSVRLRGESVNVLPQARPVAAAVPAAAGRAAPIVTELDDITDVAAVRARDSDHVRIVGATHPDQ